MKAYRSKAELIAAIQNKYAAYISEFTDIPESKKHLLIADVDRTPAENLAYQLGWVNLLLEWEQKEQQGKVVQTPADGYKWNNLSGLYQSFYQKYRQLTLTEQQAELTQKVTELCKWLESLSDKELFEPEQRRWATTKAKWPVYKWIHINTVAPFTNFRTKIRKWKKSAL